MVSIWLGNIKTQEELEKYVDLTFDENGESVASKFFSDFKIDMDETDEDFVERVVLAAGSNDISVLLKGCSYEETIIPKVNKHVKLSKYYNTVILMYNFEYGNSVHSTGSFDFISTTNYLK